MIIVKIMFLASVASPQVGSVSGHAEPINKLAFTPGGLQLVTVSDDWKVKVV